MANLCHISMRLSFYKYVLLHRCGLKGQEEYLQLTVGGADEFLTVDVSPQNRDKT